MEILRSIEISEKLGSFKFDFYLSRVACWKPNYIKVLAVTATAWSFI